ncbi:MAG: GltB/FmdC/FwdC-like GXGXG domain-containing protein [Candidatus Aquicultorales bacterium]
MVIDATGLHYRQLNEEIRAAVRAGARHITLNHVVGQRFIGDGLKGDDVVITVNGVPGGDLGAFMDGPTVIVHGNAQDHVGNTMNDGKIVVHGDAGDVLGYGMRGGKLFVKGDVGYRVGIHMKSYHEKVPNMVIGGRARDFFGEYMAGGVIVLLGLNSDGTDLVGNYLGTGMHGGTIYMRGRPEKYQLGKEVDAVDFNDEDDRLLAELIEEYAQALELDAGKILDGNFTKISPVSARPYGKLYAY